MATGTITSSGLGSGLDIEGLIGKLMSVEQQPIIRTQYKEAKETAKLSALGQVKSVLSSLQAAAAALDTPADFAASFKANVADTSIASATTGTSAVAGSYNLEVLKLADVQKVATTGFASLSSAITAQALPQTLTIDIGTTTFDANGNPTGFTADEAKKKTITIDANNNSLEGLRDAINAAKAGVSASIINDGGATPYRLILTANSPGSTSSFRLSGITDLNYDPGSGSGTNVTNVQHASDARIKLDGIAITSQSNVVTGAIEGVTLALTKANPGSTTKLTVAGDNSAIQNKITAFVKAYNDVLSTIKSQASYNSQTKVAGTLNGDATVRTIQSQLNGIITSSVAGGSLTRLSEIGISFKRDGSLSFESSKLVAALSDPTKDVARLFVKDGARIGIASKLDTAITSMFASGGAITARTDGINASIKILDKRIETLKTRMSAIETRYRAQFTALDKTISSMNSTSAYLTQQLASLANLSNSN